MAPREDRTAQQRGNSLPFVEIRSSPLAPDIAPVRIHYRESGAGRPIVVLHGGWGYEIYPFDRQIPELMRRHRVVIPDRSGYGGSPPIRELPSDFHRRAADETRAVIDALNLDAPILWGHSDGAIIALMLGLSDAQRIRGVIVEATHLYKTKPGSRAFFEAIGADADSIGARAAAVLAREHGERWRQIIDLHSRAWLRIASSARSSEEDFYDGRLHELKIPMLLVHGVRDPRTEPGELEALREALQTTASTKDGHPETPPPYRVAAVFAEGGHSPHSERATADAVTEAATAFVEAVHDRSRPAAANQVQSVRP